MANGKRDTQVYVFSKKKKYIDESPVKHFWPLILTQIETTQARMGIENRSEGKNMWE